MRAILAAILLTFASVSVAAPPAFADGIERPRAPRPAPRPRPRAPAVRPAPVEAPAPVIIPQGPETVLLQPTTLAGGVGVDIGAGYGGEYVGGGTIIVRGARASAVAISFARASASAHAGFRGGFRGGRHGGGCGRCR